METIRSFEVREGMCKLTTEEGSVVSITRREVMIDGGLATLGSSLREAIQHSPFPFHTNNILGIGYRDAENRRHVIPIAQCLPSIQMTEWMAELSVMFP